MARDAAHDVGRAEGAGGQPMIRALVIVLCLVLLAVRASAECG